MSGSNIFCAGFTGPAGVIPDGLEKGAIVAVCVRQWALLCFLQELLPELSFCVVLPERETPNELQRRTSGLMPSACVLFRYVQGKQHAVAIGQTTLSGEDIKRKNKGTAVNSLHYLADGLWPITKLQ